MNNRNIASSPTYRASLRDLAETLPLSSGTLLVTGATGLIGSALVDLLLEANRHCGRGLRILALSRSLEALQTRFPDGSCTPTPNADASLILIPQDITQPLDLPVPPDYILHLASNADPATYAEYPAETLLTAILGTRNVLEYCRRHPKTRLLLASTFEVYGRIPDKTTYFENDVGLLDFNQIRSSYPEGKRAAENLLRCYGREYNTDGVIARLPSVYGPTMKPEDSKAHAQFLRSGLAGQSIVLKSKGDQKRAYCYLMDAISALLQILLRGEANEAYNIANPNSIAAIAEVAEEVARLCGVSVLSTEATNQESQTYSPPIHCILDSSKLHALTWQPRYTLRQGLQETLQILRETESESQKQNHQTT